MKTRMVVAIGAAALIFTACGGDDDASSDDPTADPTAEPADEPTSGPADDEAEPTTDPAEAATDQAPASSGLNLATITVGDRTFDFEWETSSIQLCDPDFFGGFAAIAAGTTGQAGFDAEFAEEGTPGYEDRLPRIEVSEADDGVHWTADPDETAGTMYASWPARVDSFEIDGNRVSGTATFVGDTPIGEEPVGVPGTFDITCNG